MSSVIISAAIRRWHSVRAEFELVRENAYQLAEHETNGNLLNARGKAAGIDPYSLFIGPQSRADAYASEELLEHWQTHHRLTFAEFEEQQLVHDWSAA